MTVEKQSSGIRIVRLLDWIVIGGAAFVLVVAPLTSALGDGMPFRIAGTVALVLLFLWMVKLLACLAIGKEREIAVPTTLKLLAPPIISLFGLTAFAIFPLPPAGLKALSPTTYKLYQKCINGWPTSLDYDLAKPANPAPGPKEELRGGGARELTDTDVMDRALSIAPVFTKSGLLFGCAYIAFFLVVAFYPFDSGND